MNVLPAALAKGFAQLRLWKLMTLATASKLIQIFVWNVALALLLARLGPLWKSKLWLNQPAASLKGRDWLKWFSLSFVCVH